MERTNKIKSNILCVIILNNIKAIIEYYKLILNNTKAQQFKILFHFSFILNVVISKKENISNIIRFQ